MSDSKYRYYEVTRTFVVRANNKADAEAAAMNRRGVDAKVLQQEITTERITAGDAQDLVAQSV